MKYVQFSRLDIVANRRIFNIKSVGRASKFNTNIEFTIFYFSIKLFMK